MKHLTRETSHSPPPSSLVVTAGGLDLWFAGKATVPSIRFFFSGAISLGGNERNVLSGDTE